MDENKIIELMNSFDNSSAVEMKLKIGECQLNLKKAGAYVTSNSIALNEIDVEKTNLIHKEVANEIVDKGEQYKEENLVRSPIVGTFYTAPAEDREPYVHVGKVVKQGEVLALLEAMKMMSEVVAPRSGVIKECLAENGEVVDYDKPLFVIE